MTISEMIDALISEMTLHEKITMIHGAGLFETGGVPRLGIPPLVMTDGPMGVRAEFQKTRWLPLGRGDDEVSYLPSNGALACTWDPEMVHEVGRVLGAEVRGRGKDVSLAPGINLRRGPLCGRNFEYFSEDPCLTANLAMPLIEGIQENDVASCVKHFALNQQETERLWANVELSDRALDMYLYAFHAACTGCTAYCVHADGAKLQPAADTKKQVATAVKDQAADSVKTADARRQTAADARISGAWSIMSAYNLVRGKHASESSFLLNDILRKKWNYNGCVISDWGAVHHTVPAAESGLDIEMSVTDDFDEYCMAKPLEAAVREGKVPESAIDEKIRHILTLMLRIHKIRLVGEPSVSDFVHAVSDENRRSGTVNIPKHAQVCLKAAQESIVLLKNEGHLLPLRRQHVHRILVIGDNAKRKHSHGGGSAEIKALYEKTPVMGLRAELGGSAEIHFLPGYAVSDAEKDDEAAVNWQADSLKDAGRKDDPQSESQNVDEGTEHMQKNSGGKASTDFPARLRQEAVRAAAEGGYDAVIFIGGLNHDFDTEGKDRENIALPYEQDALVSELLKVRPDLICVIMAGSAAALPWKDRVKAILYMGYAGMEGGSALAQVIFGEVNPSGKLAETWPVSLEHTAVQSLGEFPGRPLTIDEKKSMDAHLTETFRDDIFIGYRYNEKAGIPAAYPFGFGLSYTTFEYSDMDVTGADQINEAIPEDSLDSGAGRHVRGALLAHVTVKNTGFVPGTEIVEAYLGRKHPGRQDPAKELIGFARVSLQPGERKDVELKIDPGMLEEWSEKKHRRIPRQGEYMLYIGSSSADIRMRKEISL